jgi:phytoene dehydrogenase-like protein
MWWLEAARTAAERGHDVVLAEASNRLGGSFGKGDVTPKFLFCTAIGMGLSAGLVLLLGAKSMGSDTCFLGSLPQLCTEYRYRLAPRSVKAALFQMIEAHLGERALGGDAGRDGGQRLLRS